jgi:hypothetical protein
MRGGDEIRSDALCTPTDTDHLDDNPENESSPPNLCIFLGGTNDLPSNEPVETIFDNIKSTIAIPLSKGSRVLLMTVLECHAKTTSLDARRDRLNNLIREYAGEQKNV